MPTATPTIPTDAELTRAKLKMRRAVCHALRIASLKATRANQDYFIGYISDHQQEPPTITELADWAGAAEAFEKNPHLIRNIIASEGKSMAGRAQ